MTRIRRDVLLALLFLGMVNAVSFAQPVISDIFPPEEFAAARRAKVMAQNQVATKKASKQNIPMHSQIIPAVATYALARDLLRLPSQQTRHNRLLFCVSRLCIADC